jgi:hypothetical protein
MKLLQHGTPPDDESWRELTQVGFQQSDCAALIQINPGARLQNLDAKRNAATGWTRHPGHAVYRVAIRWADDKWTADLSRNIVPAASLTSSPTISAGPLRPALRRLTPPGCATRCTSHAQTAIAKQAYRSKGAKCARETPAS